ncbi:MAG: penicillin-binding transpeptidase domain-containing protein [Candidatus Nanopelagicales bacterium]
MARRLVATLALLPLLTLGACSSADTAGAETMAADLAAALTARELAGLSVEGGGQAQLDTALAGVDGIPAKVSVADVDVDGDTASATLSWQWETRPTQWSYTSTASLRRTGDQWAAQWAPALVEPSLAVGESLAATTLEARRGDILGAGDSALVTQRAVVRFGLDKAAVPAARADRSAKALAKLVRIDPDSYAARVEKADPKAFVEAVVLRQEEAGGIDEAALAAIPGARSICDELPLGPTRGFAAEILGRVGPATAEIIEKSDGRVRPGDEVGLSGLQARYDEQLAGTPGDVVTAVGSEASTEARTLFSGDAVDGVPLRTTLDARLQTEGEDALDDIGPPSALVALRPSTGEILAAASGEGSNGYSTVTVGQYAPGSTMKVVTALALMRAGLSPSDDVRCSKTLVVNGKTFKNYDAYPADRLGDIPLRSAVANSCNTALISQRDRLADTDLTDAAAALGLGVDHDLGFPAYFGQVPTPSSETEKAASLIGQGKVLASPMAMAAVAASVGEGRAVVPQLIRDRELVEAVPAQPLTKEEAAALRDMMRAVVTEGTATFLRDVPGPSVGAKTGTAEFGSGDPLPTHAWMIATQGDLAVAAFVEEGQSGSQTAGPVLEDFLRAAQ